MPEKFSGVPITTRPRLFFPEILMDFCSDRSYECVRIVLPVPENRGYFFKLGMSLDTPRLPFSKIFNGFLFGWMDPANVAAKFEVRIALPVSEIIGGTFIKKTGQSLDIGVNAAGVTGVRTPLNI